VLAGVTGGPGSVDGTGAAARFNYPEGVAVGHALGGAGDLSGQAVGRQARVQLQPVDVVLEYVGAPAFVRQPHPHNLIEAAWAAQSWVNVLGSVGGGQHEYLAAFLDAIEQDQELGDGGNLVLGALCRPRRGDRVYLVK
jgi:hypothetical protein